MYTKEQIVERFKKVHGDKYDYSEVIFSKTTEKVCIICPEHGKFEQTPHAHLKGQGCPFCGIIKRSKSKTNTREGFIKRAIELYGDTYDYSKVNYINCNTPVVIICPKHGEFALTPHAHIGVGRRGCPICGNAKKGRSKKSVEQSPKTYEHKEIKSIKTDYNYQKDELYNYIASIIGESAIERNNNTILNGIGLDIYIPSKQLAFEFDDLYWHSEVYKNDKNYHLNKTKLCETKGIKLIHIFEDEWITKNEICISRIKNLLGVSNRIYARKCKIVELDKRIAREFFIKNHIQGHVNSNIVYGLEYNGEIVSVMSFGHLRKNLGQKATLGHYELLRFSNKLNTTVIGGASKLFKYFIENHKPIEVISYADRRWSNGGLYEQLGFEFSHNSYPNYFYIIDNERKNRFNFRKNILISKYGCSPNDTEHNFCKSNGWYRIYDCGTKVYKWKTPNN